jgi:hypothetical protein
MKKGEYSFHLSTVDKESTIATEMAMASIDCTPTEPIY